MAELYVVTGQKEMIDLGSDGGPVKVQEITFRSLPSNTIATVRIPVADLSADTARAAIEARRDVIEAVHSL